MKQPIIFLTVLLLSGPLALLAATVTNTDSQEYDLQIQESGLPYGGKSYGPYNNQYRIIEHSEVNICFYGCVMTLLRTGQTLTVNPNDSVVIDDGVMNVRSGVNERGGW